MSLYENINRRKRLGISRSKSESTISDANYKNMQEGFPKKGKSTKKVAKKVKEKKMKKSGLTDKQIKSLEKHKVHHTSKHMSTMRKEMKKGKSFKEAHSIAMSMVGK